MEFDRVFSRFSWENVPVVDVAGDYVGNDWIEDWPGTERLVRAIPLMDASFDLQIYGEGSASGGTYLKLITDAELYYTDILADTQTKLQTYVNWQGYLWRVTGDNLFFGNVARYRIYTLPRYIR